jgi:hypothetical protein
MFSRKLIVPDISATNKFFPDISGNLACLDTCYFISLVNENDEDLFYFTALLNSNLLDFLFGAFTANVRGGVTPQ